MKSKKQKAPTKDVFLQRLDMLLCHRQALYQLSYVLDWEELERDFESLYGVRDRRAKPIRLMVGLLLLKHIENQSDERVCEAWWRGPYMQYFCGGEFFPPTTAL